MPGQRKQGQVQFNVWLDKDLREAAGVRAKERGEDLAEVIRRHLIRYSRPRPNQPGQV